MERKSSINNNVKKNINIRNKQTKDYNHIHDKIDNISKSKTIPVDTIACAYLWPVLVQRAFFHFRITELLNLSRRLLGKNYQK